VTGNRAVTPAAGGRSTDAAIADMPWAEAYRTAYRAAGPLPFQTVPLAQALGQTLASDITALQGIPHYSSSAMDGWAVAGDGPWAVLEPEPEALPWEAHESVVERLEPGHAVAILTGGAIPDGTTGVLRSEHGFTETEGGRSILHRNPRAAPDEPYEGQHIRHAAEEARPGELTISAGRVLNPAHIALAAVCGHDTLPVLRAPRVSLLLTGDEVIEAGLPKPGQVRDTFGPQLPALVGMMGGHVDTVRRAPDVLDDVVSALGSEAADATAITRAYSDVVITTGGTGTSSADHIRRAVELLDGEFLIHSIAMRPGHPTLLARLGDGRFLVGLPGNPLAAMMACLTVVQPLLAGLRGAAEPGLGTVLAGTDFDPLPGRSRLVPYWLEEGRAVPAQYTHSGMLRGLADAHGVMIIPAEGCMRDQPLRTIELPW
jgi:molybdopterin molybdotransferase